MAKTALVTGANSGIGKAAATALAQQGYQVTLLVRNKDRGEAARADIARAAPHSKPELLVCDLASQRSIRDAAATYLKTHPKLDVLICAAGVFMPERVPTADGLETTFAINVIGYHLLTRLLAPALKKAAPSRVVFVSSRYGGAKLDLDDLQMEKRKYSYLKSTPPTMLGRVLLMQALADEFKADGIHVNAIHPGLVAHTQLLNQTGGFFRWLTNRLGTTPEKGAATAVWLATSPEAANETGKLWHKGKPMKTPGQAADPEFRRKFLEACDRLAPINGSPAARAGSRKTMAR